MGTERVAINTFEDHLRHLSRKDTQQERRPVPTSAADLLGPGFGPTATEVLDWNADEPAFNGFFWAPTGSINSPDPTAEWVGISIVEDDSTYGVQQLWTPRSEDPVRTYVRRFTDPGGTGTRTYTAWRGDSDWNTTGVTPYAGTGGTIVTQCWRTTKDSVSLTVKLELGTAIAVNPANGDTTNTPLLQVPAGIIPSRCPYIQILGGGSSGPATEWYIDSDGIVYLSCTVQGANLAVGVQVAVGGVYLL